MTDDFVRQSVAPGRKPGVPGSTVDRIPLIDMPEFPINVPEDIGEQTAIGKYLGVLDGR